MGEIAHRTRRARRCIAARSLAKIGMPIGGLCAGQLYLGGDGRLWHWDIFNRHIGTGAEHYAKPMKAASPLDQGFALRVTAAARRRSAPLDAAHWQDVSFTGEYPIGYVSYADPECPVEVCLEAFSPFIPLNVEDSSLPATVLRVHGEEHRADGGGRGAGRLAGKRGLPAQRPEARGHPAQPRGARAGAAVPRMQRRGCSGRQAPSERPDIVFDDFERETYDNWTATRHGVRQRAGRGGEDARVPGRRWRAKGKRLVNSHASAPGSVGRGKGRRHGALTSRPFTHRAELHHLPDRRAAITRTGPA